MRSAMPKIFSETQFIMILIWKWQCFLKKETDEKSIQGQKRQRFCCLSYRGKHADYWSCFRSASTVQ